MRQLPKLLLFFKFFRKLHENERIWTPGGHFVATILFKSKYGAIIQWVFFLFISSNFEGKLVHLINTVSVHSSNLTQHDQWRIQEGAPEAPRTKIFLISCSFLGKSGKFVCWRPFWKVGVPSYEESWIRPDDDGQ